MSLPDDQTYYESLRIRRNSTPDIGSYWLSAKEDDESDIIDPFDYDFTNTSDMLKDNTMSDISPWPWAREGNDSDVANVAGTDFHSLEPDMLDATMLPAPGWGHILLEHSPNELQQFPQIRSVAH